MKESIKERISQAFYRLLGSIVRLGLRNGLTYKEFSTIAKQLYVSISAEEYGLQGRPTNMARIALMTGMDRKEIKKMMETIKTPYKIPAAPDRMAKILTAWYEDPIYKDNDDNPLSIPVEGDAPSFEHLVKQYGGDIAVVTVLREFKRSQTLSEDTTTGKLTVNKRYYIPNYHQDGNTAPELVNPDAIAQGSSMLVDHINTIFHNLYRQDTSQREKLDLRATNISVRKESVAEFYKLVDEKGMKFLEEIDHWLSINEASQDDGEVERLGVGLYFIEGENDSSLRKTNKTEK